MALKLTRTYGSWIELRDDRSGSVTRVRAVPAAGDGKIQIEIDAPQHVHIQRIPPVGECVPAYHMKGAADA